MKHIYAVIIGSEILDDRRKDKHFEFIKHSVLKRGYTLYSTFIIKDDPTLITSVFELIKKDKDAYLFCFGGIGSTPDDLTRQISSNVFSDGELQTHKKFSKDIIERFKDDAYPNRIKMSHLPKNSKLLKNNFNNMSGYYLEERYFFMPGFPNMAHDMALEALEKFFPLKNADFKLSLLAKTSEDSMIHIMNTLDKNIELSSLPIFIDNKPQVEITLQSSDQELLKNSFKLFTDFLEDKSINFKLLS